MKLIILIALTISSFHTYAQRLAFTPAPGSPFGVGTRPVDVAIGDLNGDRKLDIVTANSTSGDLTLLFGDGKGGFTRSSDTSLIIGPTAHLVTIADVNNDGKSDLIATQHDTYNVAVLLGTSNGKFTPASGSPFQYLKASKPHNHGLVLCDVNNDANLDILTSNHGNNSISVLLGNRKGVFIAAPGSPFSVGRGPYPLAVGHLDGDGNFDIAIPNLMGNSVSVLFGDGKGGFTSSKGSPYPVKPRPYNSVIGDINADDKSDIITSHDDMTKLTILLNDGKGGFEAAPNSPLDVGHRAYKIIVIDINNDDRMDLVMCAYPRYVVIMMGNGKGGFSQAVGSPFEVGRDPNGIAVDDLNNDGKLDIVTSNMGDNTVTVMMRK
ncbi:MAG: VCBS repeat-containing protein [Ignavibacteriae bacterium]|nr:VCBS repeat-containing protein [Ignavibacteriota bacterium]